MKPLLTLLPIAVLLAPGQAVAKPAELTSRYTKFTGCRMIDHAQLGEDWVFHKCKGLGGIPVWLLFSDSTMGHVGFGAKANVSGIYGTDRDDRRWPIEWRGRMQNGKFRPLAVIIRMERPAGAYEGPAPNELIVFRLRPDGTSCIIGEPARLMELADRAEGLAGDVGAAAGWQLVSMRLLRRRTVRDVAGPWAAAIDFRARLLAA